MTHETDGDILEFEWLEILFIGSNTTICIHSSPQVRAYLSTFTSSESATLGHPAGDTVVNHRINVTNTGRRGQSTSVLAFSVPPGAGTAGVPLEQLFGFEKVYLAPGESVVLSFGMTPRDLTLVNEKGVRHAVRGQWRVRVGVGEERVERSFCV